MILRLTVSPLQIRSQAVVNPIPMVGRKLELEK